MTPPHLAVVFVDLVRFTSLTVAHGDLAGADAAAALEAVARTALTERGRVVKTLGDGVLFAADDPAAALECSAAIVEGLHELDSGLDARCGGAFGAVVERDGDIYGSIVNLASRIAALAEPASMVVTRGIALQGSAAGFVVSPLGSRSIRGFPEEFELFEVDLCGHDGQFAFDPVCGMRLDVAQAITETAPGGESMVFCSPSCADLYRAAPERYG